ncbi:MAG: DUF4330 domain-containing protein [Clostridia bacterium]|nr:DUF4330 domain-containing protein [Clostridia bacterium]
MDKPKFNIMDGFLIALIVLIIAAAAFILLSPKAGNSNTAQNATAQYQIELAKYEKVVAEEFQKAVENGETLMVGEKERFQAKLINAEIYPSKRLVTDSTKGSAVIAEDPVYYDIILTLESQVTETEAQILAGSNPLRVGEATAVKGKKAAGFGYIISLSLK